MRLLNPAAKIQSQRRTLKDLDLEDSISFDQDTDFSLHGSGHALTFIFGRYMLIL